MQQQMSSPYQSFEINTSKALEANPKKNIDQEEEEINHRPA